MPIFYSVRYIIHELNVFDKFYLSCQRLESFSMREFQDHISRFSTSSFFRVFRKLILPVS